MQDFIVFLLVGGAAAYLGRHLWRTTSGQKGCGSCGGGSGCVSKTKAAEPQLVQIDLGGSWKAKP